MAPTTRGWQTKSQSQPTCCSRFTYRCITYSSNTIPVVFFAPGYTQTELGRQTVDEVLRAQTAGNRAGEAGFKTLEEGDTTSSVARILICQHRALTVDHLLPGRLSNGNSSRMETDCRISGRVVEFERDCGGPDIICVTVGHRRWSRTSADATLSVHGCHQCGC
jgi:hypothetical protein